MNPFGILRSGDIIRNQRPKHGSTRRVMGLDRRRYRRESGGISARVGGPLQPPMKPVAAPRGHHATMIRTDCVHRHNPGQGRKVPETARERSERGVCGLSNRNKRNAIQSAFSLQLLLAGGSVLTSFLFSNRAHTGQKPHQIHLPMRTRLLEDRTDLRTHGAICDPP